MVDNLKFDKNNKTEYVENSVTSENVEEKWEGVVNEKDVEKSREGMNDLVRAKCFWFMDSVTKIYLNCVSVCRNLHALPVKYTNCQASIVTTKNMIY